MHWLTFCITFITIVSAAPSSYSNQNQTVIRRTALVWFDVDSPDGVEKLPSKVFGGHEENGDPQYICRTVDPNDREQMYPGKFTQKLCITRVASENAYYNKNFQILLNPNKTKLKWRSDADGQVPRGAVIGGFRRANVNSTSSTYLYIGRKGKDGNAVQVGQIDPDQGGLLIHEKLPKVGKEPQPHYKELFGDDPKVESSYEVLTYG